MNLLTDPWVPVRCNGRFAHITYRDVLCRAEDWQLSLPRDDMEFAALQLLICLTQVIFMPDDADALRAAEARPMDETSFEQGVQPYVQWFDLFHEKWPFMQTRGVKAKHPTAVQKLFIGLPEGNNHALFNDVGEVRRACPSCLAIALFNQASCCPSMGGGFKAGLRESSPVTTLAWSDNLHAVIWRNVLHAEAVAREGIHVGNSDRPTWVGPIKPESRIPASNIGMLRGLFWQPIHVVTHPPVPGDGICDACGRRSSAFVRAFDKERFKYNVLGSWPHPHSPRQWRGDRAEVHFTSFRRDAPAWTQLAEFVVARDEEGEGHVPAPVIRQHRGVWPGDLHLIVGGYRNKQASILERRHELLALAGGWEEHLPQLQAAIDVALSIKDALRGKMYGLGKELGAVGLARLAEKEFYAQTELSIRRMLREIDFSSAQAIMAEWAEALCSMARTVFHDLVAPYVGTPKALKACPRSRRALNAALARILKALKGE